MTTLSPFTDNVHTALSEGSMILTAQEQALKQGQDTIYGNVSSRIKQIYKQIRNNRQSRISLERAVAFTESFKETEGQLLVLRWAKALKHYAETAQITISPGELIVGRPNDRLGSWSILYPEMLSSVTMDSPTACHTKEKHEHIILTEDDKRVIDEVLLPYWSGRDYVTAYFNILPSHTRNILFGPNAIDWSSPTGIVTGTPMISHSQHWMPDYGKILAKGLRHIREEAVFNLTSLPNPYDAIYKKPFLEAIILTCDAMVIWSKRYAALAREMASKEPDSQRSNELFQIADVCDWVPENPARTFHEALQAQWWYQLFSRIETAFTSTDQGRWDQFLLPYYRNDYAEGLITKASAMELLQCVWLNMQQCVELKPGMIETAEIEEGSKFGDICLGGQTLNGKDATNELTYLILESTRALPTSVPELCVRIHAGSPDKLLRYVAEVIKDGKGTPKLLNDERILPFCLANGATYKEALNCGTDLNCSTNSIKSRFPSREYSITASGAINYGAVIEMVCRNGTLKLYDDFQFGPKTGDPRLFTTFEQVWDAYCSQLEHLVRHALIQQYEAQDLKTQYFAAPQASLLHGFTMPHSQDSFSYEESYQNASMNAFCLETIGKGTAIDSLAAIKYLIYNTKKLTWDELLTAMENNWKGHDAIRKLCLKAPKYGNGVNWVDELSFENDSFLLDFLHLNPMPGGQRFFLRCVPITCHTPMGQVIWATPDGRNAQEYLPEGLNATAGMDGKGPAVAISSYANGINLSYQEKGADSLNMKFSPENITGEDGTCRLVQFIRTWCSLKHWHIQFNVINRETLLAAKQEPEKYRNLVVRASTHLVYFVDLPSSVQDKIIASTEQKI